MEPGIFAKTFARSTLAATLDAVAAHGLRWVQFNLASAGLPSLPDEIPDEVVASVRRETEARGIRIAALSGTFNMAHPDPRERERGLARLRVLGTACRGMGTSVMTLCTGTRDPDDMWRAHPENGSRDAWRDLLASMEGALAIAEEHDLTLAFEPEPANVVASAGRGVALQREVGSPRLKVVMDPANIIATEEDRPPGEVLADAFDLLGEHVVVAHAKDRGRDGVVRPAGRGGVPWDRFIALLQDAGFDGPLILHGLGEEDVAGAVDFLRRRIDGVMRGRGDRADV